MGEVGGTFLKDELCLMAIDSEGGWKLLHIPVHHHNNILTEMGYANTFLTT